MAAASRFWHSIAAAAWPMSRDACRTAIPPPAAWATGLVPSRASVGSPARSGRGRARAPWWPRVSCWTAAGAAAASCNAEPRWCRIPAKIACGDDWACADPRRRCRVVWPTVQAMGWRRRKRRNSQCAPSSRTAMQPARTLMPACIVRCCRRGGRRGAGPHRRGGVAGALHRRGQHQRQLVSGGRVSQHGVAQRHRRTCRAAHPAFTYPFTGSPLIILHSDGLTSRWDLATYPGLAGQHPSLLAGVLLRDFRRGRDDASVVAMRLLR